MRRKKGNIVAALVHEIAAVRATDALIRRCLKGDTSVALAEVEAALKIADARERAGRKAA